MKHIVSMLTGSRYFVRKTQKLFIEPLDFRPDVWVLANKLIEIHDQHLPRMRKRSTLDSLSYEERLYAIFSHASYRYVTDSPIKRINEFHIVPELSDEHSVVFSNDKKLGVTTKVIVSFRGTVASKFNDLLTDVFVTFGQEESTERFKKAAEKIDLIRERYPEVPLVVCGHSLGGSQAIYVSKKHSLPAYCYNPAQGISPNYINEINRHKKIRVLRVLNDPISCIAGLENIGGIILFPRVSRISPHKNHTLMNFLPETPLPEEVDL
jgi:hypothetical protein